MSVLDYPHVSHSQLTSWAERCQKAFQLQRIQRAPSTPAWWLVGGSTVHLVTEERDRRGLEFDLTPAELNVTLEIEEQTLAVLNAEVLKLEEETGVPESDWFTAGRGKGQGRAYWEENAPTFVANYLTWRTRTGWPIAYFYDEPAIELDLNVTMEIRKYLGEQAAHLVPEEIDAVGAPDRVMVLKNGELCVVDVKSGTSTPKTLAQQGLYATELEMLGLQRPKYGTFVKVKEDGGVHTPLTRLDKFDRRYFEIQFAAMKAQIETGTFLPNVGDNCRTCGVSSSCYAASGSLSAQFDPLDPNYQEGNERG